MVGVGVQSIAFFEESHTYQFRHCTLKIYRKRGGREPWGFTTVYQGRLYRSPDMHVSKENALHQGRLYAKSLIEQSGKDK
jgi:hypothetical protein